MSLEKLLEDAKGRCWINGREPGPGILCIRITEEDRQVLLNALRPWWRKLFATKAIRA